jgi:hypothetical protein
LEQRNRNERSTKMRIVQPEVTRVCENTNCSLEWEVKPDPEARELWHFRGPKGVFTVAFHKPTCLLCGDQLLEITALESAIAHYHRPLSLELQHDTHHFRS